MLCQWYMLVGGCTGGGKRNMHLPICFLWASPLCLVLLAPYQCFFTQSGVMSSEGKRRIHFYSVSPLKVSVSSSQYGSQTREAPPLGSDTPNSGTGFFRDLHFSSEGCLLCSLYFISLELEAAAYSCYPSDTFDFYLSLSGSRYISYLSIP